MFIWLIKHILQTTIGKIQILNNNFNVDCMWLGWKQFNLKQSYQTWFLYFRAYTRIKISTLSLDLIKKCCLLTRYIEKAARTRGVWFGSHFQCVCASLFGCWETRSHASGDAAQKTPWRKNKKRAVSLSHSWNSENSCIFILHASSERVRERASERETILSMPELLIWGKRGRQTRLRREWVSRGSLCEPSSAVPGGLSRCTIKMRTQNFRLHSAAFCLARAPMLMSARRFLFKTYAHSTALIPQFWKA